jgi:hypothetical protein
MADTFTHIHVMYFFLVELDLIKNNNKKKVIMLINLRQIFKSSSIEKGTIYVLFNILLIEYYNRMRKSKLASCVYFNFMIIIGL